MISGFDCCGTYLTLKTKLVIGGSPNEIQNQFFPVPYSLGVRLVVSGPKQY